MLGVDHDTALGKLLSDLPGCLGLASDSHAESEYLELPNRWVHYRVTPLAIGAEPDTWHGRLFVLNDIGQEIFAHRDTAQFVAALMHDLRAPLTSISGYANLLLLGAMDPLSDIQHQSIGMIKANAERLMAGLSNLLTAYRVYSGQFQLEREALDIVSLASEVARSRAESYARQNLKLIVDCQLPEIVIDGDRHAVWDILSILLEHAGQHSRADSEVRIALVDTRHGVDVAIQDTDTSFTIERLLADRRSFWQVPLIAADGLVTLHGGRLWTERVQEVGCRVCFTLPHAAV
jgi:signal transduction histidine kinase